MFSEDFLCCDNAFCAIAAVTGNGSDVAQEPWACRTVTLVWHTYGLVGNGGFGYLFGEQITGDPELDLSLAAYEAIGAKQSHRAFSDAIEFLRKRSMPADVAERGQIFDSVPEEVRNPIEARFYDGGDEVVKCLATFIRAHRPAIDAFLSASKGGIPHRPTILPGPSDN